MTNTQKLNVAAFAIGVIMMAEGVIASIHEREIVLPFPIMIGFIIAAFRLLDITKEMDKNKDKALRVAQSLNNHGTFANRNEGRVESFTKVEFPQFDNDNSNGRIEELEESQNRNEYIPI